MKQKIDESKGTIKMILGLLAVVCAFDLCDELSAPAGSTSAKQTSPSLVYISGGW